jgi:hypothetical protein
MTDNIADSDGLIFAIEDGCGGHEFNFKLVWLSLYWQISGRRSVLTMPMKKDLNQY